MKKKRILWIIIAIFLVYTCCTYSGAMKLRAFLITKDLSVYMNSIHMSAFGKPYYVFQKAMLAHDTGNAIGVFECHRYTLFVHVEYVGFP